MKKNYELVEVKLISLENDDVITASGESTSGAKRNDRLSGGILNFGDLGTQEF